MGNNYSGVTSYPRGVVFNSVSSESLSPEVFDRFSPGDVCGFNVVHGSNIVLKRGGTVARRVGSFCNAIVFTSYPVLPNKVLSVRFNEVSISWSGLVRFGFTQNNPALLNSRSLPRYVCPDLSSKPGYWARSLEECTVSSGEILNIYYNTSGEVFYRFNNQATWCAQPFIVGLNTQTPLWGVFDVYGNCIEIEIIQNEFNYGGPTLTSFFDDERRPSPTTLDLSPSRLPSSHSPSPESPERSTPELWLRNPFLKVFPGSFHQKCGTHASISENRCVATRSPDIYHSGQVFVSQPLRAGQRVHCEILRVEERYIGNLGIGTTSCDPRGIPSPLPRDAKCFLDRNANEHWVVVNFPIAVRKHHFITLSLHRDNRIMYSVLPSIEEYTCSEDLDNEEFLCDVDTSRSLWIMFDLFGAVASIELKGISFLPNECNDDNISEYSRKDSLAECVICIDARASMVMYPCGHCCVCERCSVRLDVELGCPICRKTIQDIIKIYYT